MRLAELLLLCSPAVTPALNAGVSARVPSRTAAHHVGYRSPRSPSRACLRRRRAVGVRSTIEEIAAESNKAAVADREAAAAAPVRAATPRPAAPRGASPPAPPTSPRAGGAGAGRGRTSCCRSSPSARRRCSRRSSSPRTSSASARRSRSGGKDDGYTKSSNQRRGERPSPPEPYSASLSVVLRDFMKRRTRVRADRTFLATLAPARKFS